MSNKEYTEQEINWRSHTIYIDLETGALIDKEDQTNYIIVNTKKSTHVHRKTGIITYTNECKRSNQLRIWK